MVTFGKKRERDVLVRDAPVDILEWIKVFARADGRSMNKQIIHVLSEYVEQRKQREKE